MSEGWRGTVHIKLYYQSASVSSPFLIDVAPFFIQLDKPQVGEVGPKIDLKAGNVWRRQARSWAVSRESWESVL